MPHIGFANDKRRAVSDPASCLLRRMNLLLPFIIDNDNTVGSLNGCFIGIG